MAKNSMYVLGINEALCASAALLKDGEIIAAASEERFTGIKNHWGFPKHTIKFCCEFARINPSQIDLVVLSYIDPYAHFTVGRAQERKEVAPNALKKLRNSAPFLEYRWPLLVPFSDIGRRLYYLFYQPRNQKKQVEEISHFLHISPEKIIRMDHHLAHAYTAYFSNPQRSDKATLVLTCDGAGDSLCACVWLVRDGTFKLLAKTPYAHSLGLLYATVTSFLGLKAHEDEYKVMGLAPYAHPEDIEKPYQVLRKLVWVNGLTFNSSFPSRHFGLYVKEKLINYRFDAIAGAVQKLTEELMTSWVKNATKATHTNILAVSGGVFQNIKVNQKVAALAGAKKVFFMPSPGDDTNSIGAAYYGYQLKIKNQKSKIKNYIKPISNLYLGPEYSEKDIAKSFHKFPEVKVEHPKNIAKTVALILAQGEIVARFAGRMEMGARALGNRSILADPRNRDVVERINKMIKMRDFWMPFAPTILAEYARLYLKNPKNLDAPFMILTFDTTRRGQQELTAAIHLYDKTTRPQILKKQDNPAYYQIIDEFRKTTGVGAVLNTSFNLHGEPIVATPKDALRVFTKSGLEYLILEDLLITKRS